MVLAIYRNKEFTLKPGFSPLIREKSRLMASLGIYGILIGSSGMIITNIDRIMVERLMGLGSAGIYTTMAFFATLVIIPSRAVLKISDPIIAQSWKDSDMGNVRKNYYSSALNQFLIGCFILIGLWVNIDNILSILPEVFAEGNYVILLVGLAFVVDMSSGTATFILANSPYYKYQTYYTMLLVVIIVATNYFFIPLWGLTGAALSTFVAKLFLNLVRHHLMYRKFRLQPYNFKFLVIVAVTGASYAAGYLLPRIDHLIVDILIRSSVTATTYLILAVVLRLTPEMTDRYNWLANKVRK
jgi:O-antigen/teichoic acid export membrane protein